MAASVEKCRTYCVYTGDNAALSPKIYHKIVEFYNRMRTQISLSVATVMLMRTDPNILYEEGSPPTRIKTSGYEVHSNDTNW